MTDGQVRDAYAARATEYTRALGSLEEMHDLDRRRIQRWAEDIPGRVLDGGCGPGHWAAFLHEQGVDVEGVDLVPAFIESARTRFPDVPFRVGALDRLDVPDRSLHGVLAWYSLIHVPPEELPATLSAIARALVPRGRVLIGFFESATAEPFPHAITTAYYWPIEQIRHLLNQAGFTVLDIESRRDPGQRPHASISAAAHCQ